jgi:hypothetical protein
MVEMVNPLTFKRWILLFEKRLKKRKNRTRSFKEKRKKQRNITNFS